MRTLRTVVALALVVELGLAQTAPIDPAAASTNASTVDANATISTVDGQTVTNVGSINPGTLSLGSHQIVVTPQGDFASIDTKPIAAVMRQLANTTGHENDDLVHQIEQNSGDYAPPVFFVLANLLYKQGNLDDAIFWFNAGRLRADFDAIRCTDVSARDAVPALVAQMPVELRKAQFNDLDKLADIIGKVIKWDETTPYNYEYRWINLHGMGAIQSGLGNTTNTAPLTVPRDTWDALAKQNRDNYQKSCDDVIASKKQSVPISTGGPDASQLPPTPPQPVTQINAYKARLDQLILAKWTAEAEEIMPVPLAAKVHVNFLVGVDGMMNPYLIKVDESSNSDVLDSMAVSSIHTARGGAFSDTMKTQFPEGYSDQLTFEVSPPTTADLLATTSQDESGIPGKVTVSGQELTLAGRKTLQNGGFIVEYIPTVNNLENWTLLFAVQFLPGATLNARNIALAKQALILPALPSHPFYRVSEWNENDGISALIDFTESSKDFNLDAHTGFLEWSLRRYATFKNGLVAYQITRRIYTTKSSSDNIEAFSKGIEDGRNTFLVELHDPRLPVPQIAGEILPAEPALQTVPFKLGDDVSLAEATLQTNRDPAFPPSPVIRDNAKGITAFFDIQGKAKQIELQAPFGGSISGIQIGDSVEKVVSTLGQPPKPPVTMVSYGHTYLTAYAYPLDANTIVRFEFSDIAGVQTIRLISTAPFIPIIDPAKYGSEVDAYKAKLHLIIDNRWTQQIQASNGLLSPGQVHIKFLVGTDGTIAPSSIKIEDSNHVLRPGKPGDPLDMITQLVIAGSHGDPFSDAMKQQFSNGFWDDITFLVTAPNAK